MQAALWGTCNCSDKNNSNGDSILIQAQSNKIYKWLHLQLNQMISNMFSYVSDWINESLVQCDQKNF